MRRWMRACRFLAGVACCLAAETLLAAGQVQEIPANWAPAGMRPAALAGAKASSTYPSEDGRYAPDRAIDKSRGTKWVGSDAPSPAAPQWLTLELVNAQEVNAVAVFGAPVNNDGILDAQVQVADLKTGAFSTVATIHDAKWACWLATFEPVQTKTVRLLITRSSGPSPHTDLYEVSVFRNTGRPAADVWRQHAEELAAARAAAQTPAIGGEVVSVRNGDTARLANDQVRVDLREADGTWDATWLGVDAAVRRVRFAVEGEQRVLCPQGVKAEAAAFTDALGKGQELRQRWGQGLEVERRIRLYDGRPAIVVATQITNHAGHDVKLDTVKMLSLSEDADGWWHLLSPTQPPAAVGFSGGLPPCRPAPAAGSAAAQAEQEYVSAGVLAFAQPATPGALALGYLSAQEGSSAINGRFQAGLAGTALDATLHLYQRVLPAGQTINLDPLWLAVEANRYDALEHYGAAVAATGPKPVLTGANALWCSWYPIRMGISEEVVLANAAVAAKHFQPLGLSVMQLDHGWQRGDVCGDWTPNERFPHGLKWLAEQLQSRYGLKLGLWVAPTYVSFTSQLFRDHPEWLVKDAQGKPASIGQWYWKPNPETAHLDSSQPGAQKWIAETFARLSAEGACYYKIDFIAGSPALKQALVAIRQGAGPNAWLRYTQTPPLLSAGLANSSNIGVDTMDAGTPGWIRFLRENAALLAASYWTNDCLYHREVCDMGVGTKADVEEARFRLALLTLSGCSISFSDDLRTLEPPRIRMMQQCLPPGNPLGRPLDLFERELPSLWHMHCKNPAGEWDVVGLFNFEDQPQERTVDLAALGLAAATRVVAFEFWDEKLLGTFADRVTLKLAPRTARVVILRRVPSRPEVIATNMHILGGYHEIKQAAWDDKQLVLAGKYERAPGLTGKAFIYLPDGYRIVPNAPLTKGATRISVSDKNLAVQEVQFSEAQLDWSIACERTTP